MSNDSPTVRAEIYFSAWTHKETLPVNTWFLATALTFVFLFHTELAFSLYLKRDTFLSYLSVPFLHVPAVTASPAMCVSEHTLSRVVSWCQLWKKKDTVKESKQGLPPERFEEVICRLGQGINVNVTTSPKQKLDIRKSPVA